MCWSNTGKCHVLQKTFLGWVTTIERVTHVGTPVNYVTTNEVHEQLTKFWEFEEGPQTRDATITTTDTQFDCLSIPGYVS